MTRFNVPGMHCAKCVERIDRAFKGAGLDFTVSLADKTVSVAGGEPDVQKAAELLGDLGFEAERA